MYCELSEVRTAEGVMPCGNTGVRRKCGHISCDEHTDGIEDACLWCAGYAEDAAEQDEYEAMMEREEAARLEEERRQDA